jgi:hypothetical protein
MFSRFFFSTLVLATSCTIAATAPAEARDVRTPGHFGLGIGSGTISNGLSAKYFMSKQHALQFNLGSYGGAGFNNRWKRIDGLGFGADYLFEMPAITRVGQAFELAWNLGAGIGLGFRDRDDKYDGLAVAVAFIAGLEFNFIPAPFDLVLEWRPSILVAPAVGIGVLDFTAQLRFYF